jgi:NAD(P)-dependent dehydrogenase (short-subunit alcohol dehydrogenase family)
VNDAQNLLNGRVAIITGASRGIGAAIARRFAAEGARVAVVARTLEPQDNIAGSLTEVAEAIKAAGGECCMIQADLTNPEHLAYIVNETIRQLGRVDILVNNAAWCRFPPIWEVTTKHMQLAFQMNLHTPNMLSQLVYPYFKEQGEGWILNISSATADTPSAAPWNFDERYLQYNRDNHPTVYGASKAALERLTVGWALEMSGSGIAVNALAPVGAVASEGAIAVGGWDENDNLEPVEAMAEAALQLCHRPAVDCSGYVLRSLPLLKQLCVDIRNLDGSLMTKKPDDGQGGL